MIDKGVAHRYAHALFGAALKVDALDPVLADLENLEAMIGRDTSLVRFLESPRELDEHKRSLVEKLFRGKAHDLFVQLIHLLLRKKRILHLLDVATEYRKLYDAHKGIALASVTTAVSLPEDLAGRLRGQLERLSGKKVRLKTRIDPRIIAGLVVMMEGKIIDRSVRHELDRLKESLLETPVHARP